MMPYIENVEDISGEAYGGTRITSPCIQAQSTLGLLVPVRSRRNTLCTQIPPPNFTDFLRLGADCLQELDQSGSSSNSSTPASAPAESDPPTPLDTQHIEWGRMKAHWESFGGELLHFVDYVRLL